MTLGTEMSSSSGASAQAAKMLDADGIDARMKFFEEVDTAKSKDGREARIKNDLELETQLDREPHTKRLKMDLPRS